MCTKALLMHLSTKAMEKKTRTRAAKTSEANLRATRTGHIKNCWASGLKSYPGLQNENGKGQGCIHYLRIVALGRRRGLSASIKSDRNRNSGSAA